MNLYWNLRGRPVVATSAPDFYGLRIFNGGAVVDCELPNSDDFLYDDLTPFPVAHIDHGAYHVVYLTPVECSMCDIQFLHFDSAGYFVNGGEADVVGVKDTIDAFWELVRTSRGYSEKDGTYVVDNFYAPGYDIRTIQGACAAFCCKELSEAELTETVVKLSAVADARPPVPGDRLYRISPIMDLLHARSAGVISASVLHRLASAIPGHSVWE